MNLYEEFFGIIAAFENGSVDYAVIGGFAMAFHDEPRFTEDIDILVSNNNLDKINNILTELDFFRSTDPHQFLNTDLTLYRYVKIVDHDHLILDLLAGENKVFEEMLGNSVYFDWEKGKAVVVSREDLIRLKKMRNSDQDKVDIKNLKRHEKENGN